MFYDVIFTANASQVKSHEEEDNKQAKQSQKFISCNDDDDDDDDKWCIVNSFSIFE